nr:hypothetical protein [Tanacetum cinerariifolium]
METLTVESPIPTVSSLVPTACLNDSPKPSIEARLNLKRVANQEETPSLDNILSLTNRFEDILGVTTSPDETIRVEADVSNMETSISASPTPTLRIHKDHPKSQIIGPVDTSIQTRHKSKMMEEQSFIATIHQKTDPALLQFCLFSCFLSQVEPKKPPGFQDSAFLAKVYKVEKAMYGLHQALRAWYGTLSKYLLKNGFQRGTIDQTLFIRSYAENLKPLCMKIPNECYGSSNTPMDKENPWGKDGTGKDVELHLYRSMIGSLMYLTASRLDIMFTGHPKLGLWYPKASPFDLVAYLDSDYGGASQERKSTTGGSQFLCRRLISWQCKKQTIVATSTTEAEYVAAASCCGQVLEILVLSCKYWNGESLNMSDFMLSMSCEDLSKEISISILSCGKFSASSGKFPSDSGKISSTSGKFSTNEGTIPVNNGYPWSSILSSHC